MVEVIIGLSANPISLIIKNSAGNPVTTASLGTISPALTNGAMVQGTLYTIPSGTITALTAGTYTATLVTNAGGSFVSPSFTVS